MDKMLRKNLKDINKNKKETIIVDGSDDEELDLDELDEDEYVSSSNLKDPLKIVQVLGSSLIISAVMYTIVSEVLTSQNLSGQNIEGGLWDLGLFLLSVIPVVAAVVYIFN